jgi:hypothetical protein
MFAAILGSAVAHADGGHLQMRQAAGPFVVSLFTTPEDLGIGPADLSTMVEDQATGRVLLDAEVFITLTPGDGRDGAPVVTRLTHANATNKLMQDAIVRLPRAGVWHAVVDVRQGGREGSASTMLSISGHSARRNTTWALAAFPLLVIGVFAIVQNGKSRIRRSRPIVVA